MLSRLIIGRQDGRMCVGWVGVGPGRWMGFGLARTSSVYALYFFMQALPHTQANNRTLSLSPRDYWGWTTTLFFLHRPLILQTPPLWVLFKGYAVVVIEGCDIWRRREEAVSVGESVFLLLMLLVAPTFLFRTGAGKAGTFFLSVGDKRKGGNQNGTAYNN